MSTIKANTLSNVAGSQSISTDRVAQGTAFAWVNFNGTGTVAIRQAYNVSSITDNGLGLYTVNLTIALPDSSPCILGTCSNYSADRVGCTEVTAVSASSVQMRTGVSGASAQAGIYFDPATVSVALFR